MCSRIKLMFNNHPISQSQKMTTDGNRKIERAERDREKPSLETFRGHENVMGSRVCIVGRHCTLRPPTSSSRPLGPPMPSLQCVGGNPFCTHI